MAARWYWKAADQGYASAQLNLGLMYRQGLGLQQDYKVALFLFRKAAEQGQARAQFNLGEMYFNGEGMQVDMVKAHKWLKLAAASGEADAEAKLKAAEEKMTAKQISEADVLVQDWLAKRK